jgi:hypothetical protein
MEGIAAALVDTYDGVANTREILILPTRIPWRTPAGPVASSPRTPRSSPPGSG